MKKQDFELVFYKMAHLKQSVKSINPQFMNLQCESSWVQSQKVHHGSTDAVSGMAQ